MFPYTKKLKNEFLRRFGIKLTIDGIETLGILEKKIIIDERAVSETIYITADHDEVQQDFVVVINETKYKIDYIVDDGTGLSDCYLSLISSKGRDSRYE